METYQVSLGGALLVIAFTLVYIVLFFMVLFKIFGQRRKNRISFVRRRAGWQNGDRLPGGLSSGSLQ